MYSYSIYLAVLLSMFFVGFFILIPVCYLFLSDFWFYSIVLFGLYVFYRFPIYFQRVHRQNHRK